MQRIHLGFFTVALRILKHHSIFTFCPTIIAYGVHKEGIRHRYTNCPGDKIIHANTYKSTLSLNEDTNCDQNHRN